MTNTKFKALQVLGLAALLIGGSGVAFGQSNIPGFRGMNRRKHEVTPPPPPSEVVSGPNMDCTLILPKAVLTAKGLSTPFLLTATDPAEGPCDETNNAQSAFVQAAIIDPATGAISVYNPLIINEGTSPAVAPVVPSLPPNAIVALWFGYNADNLTLTSASPRDLETAKCVNGLPGSVFSQFSYCNAPAFFRAANAAIANGMLTVPPLGMANDGMACPSVRDFFVVDQDQSDNLPTLYLIINGQLAQNTQDNNTNFPTAIKLGNPSDNRLTDVFLDGALACQPWTVPDLTDTSTMHTQQLVPALALNELQARMYQATPVALVPGNDPMAELTGNENIAKVNLYRMGVDQPIADSFSDIDPSRYCRQILRIAPARMFHDFTTLSMGPSPDPGAASNLFTFLAQRFVASYEILNCETLIQQPDPITVTTSSAGVATAASMNSITYMQQVQDLAGQKAADDAADSAALSLKSVE